jgi:heat shock protein HslJ
MLRILSLFLLLLALPLAACGSDEDETPAADPATTAPAATTTPEPATSAAATEDAPALVTADDLAGRTFLLEHAEVGGQPKELAGGKPISLAFEQDRLSAQPGCNGASGNYTLEDGRIVLDGPLAQTMMMCADEALVQQDEWFASVLEAKPLVALDGDAITLTTDDTVLQGRDKEVASPDLPLEGTEWRIESRIEGSGPDAAVSSELWMEASKLRFEPGGRLQGSTACGGVLGTWTLDGDAVTIALEPHGPCQSPDDPGKGEEQTFSLLAGEDLTLSVDADQATLTHADGSGVVLRAIVPAVSTSTEGTLPETAG